MKNSVYWEIPTNKLVEACRFSGATGSGGTETFIRIQFGVDRCTIGGYQNDKVSGSIWASTTFKCNSKDSMEFCVDPSVLTPLATVQNPLIRIEVSGSNGVIKWLTGHIKFPVINTEDFPSAPVGTDIGLFATDSAELKSALSNTKPAAKMKGNLDIMTATLLSRNATQLNVVCMDGQRFHMQTIPCSEDCVGDSIVLPPKLVSSIMSIQTDSQLTVRWNEYRIYVETIDGHEIVCQRLVGKYPTVFQGFLDSPEICRFKTDRKIAESVLKRFIQTYPNIACKVFLESSSAGIKLSSESPTRSSEETLDIEWENEVEIKDTYFASQLLDAVKSCGSTEFINVSLIKKPKSENRFIKIWTETETSKFTAVLAPFIGEK